MRTTRRAVLSAGLASATLPVLVFTGAEAQEGAPALDLTPACGDHEKPTVAQTEGPYFKPNAPLRHDLAADAPNGERMMLAGLVLDAGCRPVPRALVQIWHADEAGRYDNAGHRLRGYQYADEAGRWWFSTIVPGLYPGRTRHYHIKVQKPGGRVLTTQLYFPDEPQNQGDGLFDRRLLMRIGHTEGGRYGRFDLVV